MSYKNATLMVSAMANRIYLGTLKKNSPFPVMNDSRVDFTDQVIRAMITHMQGMDEGKDCYEVPGVGRLVWEPALPKAIESDESAQASAGSRIGSGGSHE
jgi:hypothetical protein